MAVGTNGPPVLNGNAYLYPNKTLAQLRERVYKRLGFGAMAAHLPGVDDLLDDFLIDGHEQLYHRYETLRQKRWWTIPLTQANRHYDVPQDGAQTGELTDIAFADSNPDVISRVSGDFTVDGFVNGDAIRVVGSGSNDGVYTVATVAALTLTLIASDSLVGETAGATVVITVEEYVALDMRYIEYAGLLDGTIWTPMIGGIDPILFNITQQSRPTHYEVREYVEVFPEPDQAYTLYIKGRSALRAFAGDDDVTSMDPQPVFLHALANAKAHYGQPDSRIYFQQLEAILGALNSGTFGTKRYIPDPEVHVPALPYPRMNPPRP